MARVRYSRYWVKNKKIGGHVKKSERVPLVLANHSLEEKAESLWFLAILYGKKG